MGCTFARECGARGHSDSPRPRSRRLGCSVARGSRAAGPWGGRRAIRLRRPGRRLRSHGPDRRRATRSRPGAMRLEPRASFPSRSKRLPRPMRATGRWASPMRSLRLRSGRTTESRWSSHRRRARPSRPRRDRARRGSRLRSVDGESSGLLESELHGQKTLRYALCAHVHAPAGAQAAGAGLSGLRVAPWGAACPGERLAAAVNPDHVISATKTNLFMASSRSRTAAASRPTGSDWGCLWGSRGAIGKV